MPLKGYTDRDRLMGQAVTRGTGEGIIPAFVQVDMLGNEVPFAGASVGASSGNVANATATATIAAVAAKTNYITSLEITGSGATAASVVQATVTGLAGGTQRFIVTVPAGVTTAVEPLIVSFNPPHAATGTNVAIAASLPALGAGSTNASVNIRGIQK